MSPQPRPAGYQARDRHRWDRTIVRAFGQAVGKYSTDHAERRFRFVMQSITRGHPSAGLRHLAALPYRRDMPARKRPAPEDTATARRLLLDGLARDADPSQLVNDLAFLHPRDNTLTSSSRSGSVPPRGELPRPAPRTGACGSVGRGKSASGRNRSRSPSSGSGPARLAPHQSSASAAMPRNTSPGAWWQADDFWQYALFAAVAYVRAAPSRAGVPVRQACQDLSERPGHPVP